MLAGLLVFYHQTMLYDLANGHGLSKDATYNAIQSALRATISQLGRGHTRKQIALWAMWASIGGLIATQYWAHYGLVAAEFTDDPHPLSYLKRVIFPSIITTALL